MIDDADMAWTSNIDGAPGTGRNFTDALSAGTNVITLAVTYDDSSTYSPSISLTITP
ncbi:MAG: hypothetical protein KA297_00290 [Kofleriaceae bacterium]|jgi:hypothetical protein|nr:hypothetical protein [Kofleriaceae bacterium]